MTTSDEFSLLAEAPKDRWGRYKISDPASGKERGYTRVTTIAKVLDDSSSLADWKTRMAITGIVQRADLLAQASTSLDDRSKLNKIANDAIEAAGAYSRANLGTALHSITQQLDLGMKPQILAGLQSDIETYVASIAAWDFGMKKEWIEVLLINDEFEYVVLVRFNRSSTRDVCQRRLDLRLENWRTHSTPRRLRHERRHHLPSSSRRSQLQVLHS